jgi:hypothetical protein
MTEHTLKWTSRKATRGVACKIGKYGPVDVLVASSRPSIEIINTPECVGAEFQGKLSKALGNVVDFLLDEPLGSMLSACPLDVIYVLRGGLNFNLHQVLRDATGTDPEVSFISSQRIEGIDGFQIGETGYSKWSIQNSSVLCIGDICATGTTLTHLINAAISRYRIEEKALRHLLVISIGTANLMNLLAEAALKLKHLWANMFEGVTAVFLEGIFTLYHSHPLLLKSHLSNTDFFRKDSPRSIQLEIEALKSPTTLLERCAIYDGGSRSFEPALYLNNLARYWQLIDGVASRLSVHELLAIKTDALDYQLPYEQWRKRRPWWRDETDIETMRDLHRTGHNVVEELQSIGLKELCERRLKQIQQNNKHNKQGAHPHESN